MTRLQRILAAILIIQLIITGLVYWSQRPAAAESGELLEDFDAERVVALTIEDNNQGAIALEKGSDGWFLANGSEYPADQEAISSLLDDISTVKTNRLVTRSPASHDRLEVADDNYSRKIQLELDDGTIHELFLGSSPNPRSLHVRLDRQDEVYLTGDLLRSDVVATTANWIDTSYVDLDRESVTSLVLENANGTFELEKDGDVWSMADLEPDEQFDEAGVNSILNRISTLRMVEPLSREQQSGYGLDDPRAVLRVTLEDESGNSQTYTLLIGGRVPSDDTFLAKWSESPYFVKIASSSANTLVDTNRDDFVAQPPAEDAADTGTGASQGSGGS